MCITREVCPASLAILVVVGYFHKLIVFVSSPCPVTSSQSSGDHKTEHTADLVWTDRTHLPVFIFQNMIRQSPIPLPVARSLLHQGAHANALKAALWWVKRKIDSGELEQCRLSHTLTRLLFLPEASFVPTGFHFSLQISPECPAIVATCNVVCIRRPEQRCDILTCRGAINTQGNRKDVAAAPL